MDSVSWLLASEQHCHIYRMKTRKLEQSGKNMAKIEYRVFRANVGFMYLAQKLPQEIIIFLRQLNYLIK